MDLSAQHNSGRPSAPHSSYNEALEIALNLPKCELHMHLDGSLLPDFLFERACARGIRNQLPDTAFELRGMIDTMKSEMRKKPSAGHSGVETGKNWPLFDLMNTFLQTADELETASFLLATHLRNVHNVKVFELRFCPSLHTVEGLTELEAVQAVGKGLSKAENEGKFFRTGIIICALRSYPPPHAIQLAQLAHENLRCDDIGSNMVVGFDVAGSEQFPLTLPHIKEALLFCVENKIPLTVHAGEIPSGTYQNLEVALSLPVQRIGHGAALAFDQLEANDINGVGTCMSSTQMMSRVNELGITVEVCLTSITTPSKGLPTYQHHPIKRLLGAGVKCVLSCDNLLLSGDPNTSGPVDHSSRENGVTPIPGGLGVCYAHPSGEVAHVVAECGLSWSETREVLLEGVKSCFCFGMTMTEDKQAFIAQFERELDQELVKAGVL